MNPPSRCILFSSLLFVASVAVASTEREESVLPTSAAPAIEIALDAGELLSIISLRNRHTPEARAALQIYGREAISMARAHGFENHGTLRIVETVVGEPDRELLILGTWPSEEADLAFEALPELQPYKAMRPIIWDDLRFYKAESSEDAMVRFRSDKHYTVAFAWHDPAAPADYRSYLELVTPAVEGAGGRFLHTLRHPRFVAEEPAGPGPSEINIVEWDTFEGLDALQASERFLQHYEKLQSGTTRFELYRVAPVLQRP